MKAIANLLILFSIVLGIHGTVSAQKFISKNGHIKFYSDSPMEKIEANNRQVKIALDAGTGDFVFQVLMKSFEFEKALMQEHFNENYVESDKYPNATFLGKITNLKDINLTKDGTYQATVEGKLTIHGVTKNVKENGTLEVNGDKATAKSKFNILLSDYNISVPGAVVNNISKSIEITINAILDKAK
jgi:polyisoprenoid-binding protein YceI